MDLTPIKFNLPPVETPLFKAGISYNETGSNFKSNNFGDTLTNAMNNLKDLHNQADSKMSEYAAGGDVDVADVMVTMEKASLASDLAVQIRNKFIDGYQEIIRMQI
jgi:flagellar hook-basal body complex protein FliE